VSKFTKEDLKKILGGNVKSMRLDSKNADQKETAVCDTVV
jgi:hypothetical protein